VTDPVRVAIVGLGWFAREWALPGIARSAAFTEATVVTDVDADAVEAVAAEHDVTGVTPAEFRAGAVVDEYDAVYVATPNATHLGTWRPPPSREGGLMREAFGGDAGPLPATRRGVSRRRSATDGRIPHADRSGG